MQCPYPDCTGEISEGDTFCDECGRSLAPTAVAAAKAGMAAGVPTLGAPVPRPGGSPASPPALAPLPPPLTVPLVRSGTPWPWIVVGVLALAVGSFACWGGGTLMNTILTPPLPAPGAVRVRLGDLTAANHFRVDQDVPADGPRLGVIAVRSGYTYAPQGSPDLLATVEVLVNDTPALELAASPEPKYAESNPQFAVAAAGKRYTRTVGGLHLTVIVDRVAVNPSPLLANGTAGQEPVFSELTLSLALAAAP